MQNGKPPVIPTAIAQLSLQEIQAALKRPLPGGLLKSKTLKGSKIEFISWHTACEILDKYAPGWCWEIKQMTTTSDRIFLIGRLSIPTADGIIYRESAGTEVLKETITDKRTGEETIREIAYGDPSSNAESMSFRRCCAKFGLGLYLYK
jgi:hypothetical protein